MRTNFVEQLEALEKAALENINKILLEKGGDIVLNNVVEIEGQYGDSEFISTICYDKNGKSFGFSDSFKGCHLQVLSILALAQISDQLNMS